MPSRISASSAQGGECARPARESHGGTDAESERLRFPANALPSRRLLADAGTRLFSNALVAATPPSTMR
jgi:hypothetical protein